MPDTHVIAMYMLHSGSDRDRQARESLAAALPGAEVGEPDEAGVFDVRLEAADQEDALTRVWDAIAASGTDDHLILLEHADLPEHWRTRATRPGE
jgi:hypothetical protein